MQEKGRVVACHKRSQRAHLEPGLPLGEACHRQADAEASEVFTQAADEDLAQEDDDCGVETPVRRAGLASEQHQGGADEQLVGDWVQHATHIAGLAAVAGDAAVEVIGDGRGAE